MEDKHNVPYLVKLVRDKIPEVAPGVPGVTYKPIVGPSQTTDAVYLLQAKLLEEAGELIVAKRGPAKLDELADILECCYAIAARYGVSASRLEQLCDSKREVRGGYALMLGMYHT